MVIKVCGITSQENLLEVSELEFNMIGLNFYPHSKRYLEKYIYLESENFKRVGVFVNENLDSIIKTKGLHNLDFIQLHGDEDLPFCEQASKIAPIIKVFRIDKYFDFEICNEFDSCSKYFLFDTFTSNYGGSGEKFDWTILSAYTLSTPFILSGGISLEDVEDIKTISHPQFAGVDLNSKFEISPGIKDYQKLKQFKNGITKDS